MALRGTETREKIKCIKRTATLRCEQNEQAATAIKSSHAEVH